MTSFNRYALGAVADWMHRVVAGIAPASAGYREILVKPQPGGGLTSASARHLTSYGELSIAWVLDADELTVDLVVPTGSTARVELPGREPFAVASGVHRFTA